MTDKKSTDQEIIKEKIKAIYPHIVVGGAIDKPCYSIHWYDIEKKTMYCGFSSYNLEFVRKWLREEFEIVENDIDDLINRQKADIEKIDIAFNNLIEVARLWKEKYNNAMAENERLKGEVSNARRKALLEAKEKFAGHSDYHGDTILCELICMAEGQEVGNAKPLDKSEIKAKAYKEFAEMVKSNLIEKGFYPAIVKCVLEETQNELVGE